MIKKNIYEAPESELFLVKFEVNIMSPNSKRDDSSSSDYDDDNPLGTI